MGDFPPAVSIIYTCFYSFLYMSYMLLIFQNYCKCKMQMSVILTSRVSALFLRFKNGLVFVLPIKLMQISLFFADLTGLQWNNTRF